MTIRVELSPDTEVRLKAEAEAKGLPVEKLAEELLREALAGRASGRGELSVTEFHAMLQAMAEGSEKLPDLATESFTRESFYEGRLNGRDAVPRR